MIIACFAPASRPDAHTLILGSMPGIESLRAGQYYAHPRNAFWPIMAELIGASPRLPYAERLQQLNDAGIALWDVLASCRREGSLDTAISADSLCANDFNAFYADHPHIRRVFFNGSMAETCYRRHVQPVLEQDTRHYQRLPSTSPAHAARTFAQKLDAWRVIIPPG